MCRLQFLNPRAANKKDADTVRSLVYRTYFGGKEHWSALLYAMVWSAPDCRTLSTRKLQAAVMAVPFFSKVYAGGSAEQHFCFAAPLALRQQPPAGCTAWHC